jgi:NAD(P)-dependent dehydrogenase (short-subunit alcohol dehydrogenase family)
MHALPGKVAVVLGASSRDGIGAAIARALREAGAELVVAARRVEPLAAVAQEMGARAMACDITEEDQLAALAHAVREQHGHLDIAINAAGTAHGRLIRDLTRADIERVTHVHFTGALLFIKHMAAAMTANDPPGGAIVTLSSLTATLAGEGLALYAGTKAGVDHAVRVAALEYGRKGIRVNSLAPGLVRTPLTETLFQSPGFERAFARESALGRITTATDVARAALWLSSDEAFITGQNIQVNGGASLRRLPTGAELSG